MKFSIQINAPIRKVTELFINPACYKDWKPDFISYEPISGAAGQKGAVTKLVFKRVTIIETVTDNQLPNEISALYEHKRGNYTVMEHEAVNRFTALSANQTLYETETEVVKVNGLLMKIMMTLMAGAANKYYQKQLQRFKALVETT